MNRMLTTLALSCVALSASAQGPLIDTEAQAAQQAAAATFLAAEPGLRVRVLGAARGTILDDRIILEGNASVPLSIEIDAAQSAALIDYVRTLAARDVPPAASE